MPSPEIAQAVLALETRKALSLPMAALIFGVLSQVETVMEIVDRVCDPYFCGGTLKTACPTGRWASPERITDPSRLDNAALHLTFGQSEESRVRRVGA